MVLMIFFFFCRVMVSIHFCFMENSSSHILRLWVTWGWVNDGRFLILGCSFNPGKRPEPSTLWKCNAFSLVKVSCSHRGWQLWNYYGKCSKPPSFPLVHLHAPASIRSSIGRAHMPNMPGLLCMTKTACEVCNILKTLERELFSWSVFLSVDNHIDRLNKLSEFSI